MNAELRAFRDTLGCFATGVCIAATMTSTGRPVGLTVNSFTSVSLDPRLVLFCLDNRSESLDVFRTATGFSLAILASEQQSLSNAFAKAPATNRWDGVDYHVGAGGGPVLVNALATLDCVTHAVHDGGDHSILVGRVVAFANRSGDPLLYYRGGYASLSGPVR